VSLIALKRSRSHSSRLTWVPKLGLAFQVDHALAHGVVAFGEVAQPFRLARLEVLDLR
jgi:hypothetical protein